MDDGSCPPHKDYKDRKVKMNDVWYWVVRCSKCGREIYEKM